VPTTMVVEPEVIPAPPWEYKPIMTPKRERAWPPKQGEWTYEDYMRLPDDGWQYEIIKGVLYMAAAPRPRHQIISGRIEYAMMNFVLPKGGLVLNAPLDVMLPDQETPVQPDLVYIAADRLDIVGEKMIEGAPDLVVEILSPTTWWKDRRVKLPLYAETGVRECWLVDLDEASIEVHVLRGGRYELLGKWGMDEQASSETLAGFEIAVGELLAA